MTTPPLLTGAVLMFWGWQTGLLIPGALAAVAVESHRFTSWCIDLDDTGFSRIISLCNVILVLAVILAYASKGSAISLLLVIQWFPLILLPLIVAQLYSRAGSINPDIFFVFLKTNRLADNDRAQKSISISYPFIAICILGGSLANMRSFSSYVIMALLIGWALLSVRPARYSLAAWLPLFLIAASGGYLGGIGLNTMHGKVEEKFIEWYSGTLTGSGNDYQRTTTAIGQVGSRKSSGKIVLRVKEHSQNREGFHLAQSSYDTYRSASWYATLAPMTPVHPEGGGALWRLVDKMEYTNRVSIYMQLQGEKNILPLPGNAVILENLPVKDLSQNRLGTVMVQHDPMFAVYNVEMEDDFILNGPPGEKDLAIPAKEAGVISKIAADLDLHSKRPDEAVEALTSFFMNNFVYSLDPSEMSTHFTPLEDFLLKNRTGHCEHFATSTALLLRSAGIPARYTVGYLSHEYKRREDLFVVRDRDSHAWVTAYLDGRWQTVDTTPPSWIAADRKLASFFEPLSDFRSLLWFKFSKWRASMKGSSIYWYIIALLFLILLWKLFGKGGFSITRAEEEDTSPETDRPGLDSPFYQLEERLKVMGLMREEWESYPAWFGRLEDEGRFTISIISLKKALALHNRLRFDPMGISGDERDEMEKLVGGWIREVDNLT